MSTISVAKKDFRDAIRSRTLLALTALFAIFTAGGAYVSTLIGGLLGGAAGSGGSQSALDLIFALLTPASLLVPVIGLLAGYKAIAGERESGSLKFLLGLPHSRRDIVLGKVIGRAAVVAVAILIGFAVGIVAIYVLTDALSPVNYLVFTLVTILLGVTYISIAVGFSASTGSTSRAAVAVIGVFLLFQFAWGLLGVLLLYAVTGAAFPQPPIPEWYQLFTRINPNSAYQAAATALLPRGPGAGANVPGGQGGAQPYFLESWFGFVILTIWIVVPLVLGYSRFERSDL